MRARWTSWLGPSATALATLLFLVTRAWALLPHFADEGIYFYGAARVAAGALPYRDFFHAHPPLHLAPAALLFVMFGYGSLLAKLPVFVLAAAQGPAAYLIVQRVLAAAQVPALARGVAGAVAAALLLFSESMLKASAYDTGMAQASGLVALAALALAYRRPIAAGLLCAAGPLTLLQSAPAAAMVAATALAWDGRAGLRATLRAPWRTAGGRVVLAGAALLTLVHVYCWARAGSAFWQQVYLFHLDKAARESEGLTQLGFVLFDNWTLAVAALAGLALALLHGGPPARVALPAALAALLTVVAMTTRPRVFPYYFLPAFFPAALLAGLGAGRLLQALADWRAGGARPGWRVRAPALAAAALLSVLFRPAAGVISPRRAEQLRSYQQTYTWIDGPGLGSTVNGVIRALFWQGGVRRAGTDPNALTQFLWQRSRWLDSYPALVEAVRRAAAERPGLTLLGESTVAPLVALEAGVPITGDLVDTNTQRLQAGHLAIGEVLALLDAHPSALVLSCGGGITTVPAFRAYVARHLHPLGSYPSAHGRTCTLLGRP